MNIEVNEIYTNILKYLAKLMLKSDDSNANMIELMCLIDALKEKAEKGEQWENDKILERIVNVGKREIFRDIFLSYRNAYIKVEKDANGVWSANMDSYEWFSKNCMRREFPDWASVEILYRYLHDEIIEKYQDDVNIAIERAEEEEDE